MVMTKLTMAAPISVPETPSLEARNAAVTEASALPTTWNQDTSPRSRRRSDIPTILEADGGQPRDIRHSRTAYLLAESLLDVGDQVGGVFDADGQSYEVVRHFERRSGGRGVSHGARMFDQGFDAAKAFGKCENTGA